MDRAQVLETIRTVFCSEFEFEADRVLESAHLVDDLDLDSVDGVALAIRLEEETGLTLAEDELKGFRTVGDIVELVHGRLAG